MCNSSVMGGNPYNVNDIKTDDAAYIVFMFGKKKVKYIGIIKFLVQCKGTVYNKINIVHTITSYMYNKESLTYYDISKWGT